VTTLSTINIDFGLGKGYLTSPPTPESTGLIMIQEIWGMNKSMQNTADQWAKDAGFVVLLVDLYDGKIP